ncbi:MAG: hypothetical protein QOD60_2333 [Solirubrobacterales bacterium]|jgi:PAS domain S-box-containing protein|nr:hypothetical protein [Solirubrobacterales bacterium]
MLGVDQSGVIVLANSHAVDIFGYRRDELLGQRVEVLVPDAFRANHEAKRTRYFEHPQARPMGAGLDLRARTADGREFPCEISLSAMDYEGSTLALAAIRDISERHQAQKNLLAAVGRLRAATDIAVAVGAETDIDKVLETIVERGRSLIEARALMVLLTQGDELVISAMAGDVDESLRNRRVKRTADVLWEVFGLHSSASALIVPLVFKREHLGSLVAVERLHDGTTFSEEDKRLLEAFGASAATAVATAKSVAEHRLLDTIKASERERAHWARELHDETLQSLAGVHLALTGAMRTGDAEQVHAAALGAVDQVSTQIETLRGMITELRPAGLDEIGLDSALAALVERCDTADALAVDCDVELPQPQNLGDELQTAIYRLAQEGLRNVTKHAHVDRAELSVVASNGRVHVRVRDEGVGFEPTVTGTGYGMTGMRERVTLLGGEFAVVSAPGAGAEIRADLPLVRHNLNGILRRP